MSGPSMRSCYAWSGSRADVIMPRRSPTPSVDAVTQGAVLSKQWEAIRGREQQLIDNYGGVDDQRVVNKRREIAKFNPLGRYYHNSSNRYFGQLAPYAGY